MTTPANNTPQRQAPAPVRTAPVPNLQAKPAPESEIGVDDVGGVDEGPVTAARAVTEVLHDLLTGSISASAADGVLWEHYRLADDEGRKELISALERSEQLADRMMHNVTNFPQMLARQ